MRPRGLFLNPAKAQCSIYESGRMMYQALRLSDRFDLDYMELDPDHIQIRTDYAFYLFNYHHATLAWLDTKSLRCLPAPLFTFILEVAPDDPFVLCPREDFDAFLPLDPSLASPDPRVFPMPRPLVLPDHLAPFEAPEIPVIGTFGFATPGKGFEQVVDAVGREFERARVRIHVPVGTHADHATLALQRRPYAEYLEELCRKVARPGIEVEFTRDFLDEAGLVQWCRQNTLNCFLYSRNQPGLSATTDQAIAAARPLAVGTNPTFRHIHPYLTPYPFRSLRESIAQSLPEVMRMREDWAPRHFAQRFEEVLAAHGLLPRLPHRITPRVQPPPRIPILLVNHPQKQCGVHQYGEDIAAALANSSRYDLRYTECDGEAAFREALAATAPRAVVFNHYPMTLPWVTPALTKSLGLPTAGIMHEVTQEAADVADTSLFDAHLCPDPTLVERNPRCLKIPRLIPAYTNAEALPEVPTFGSFGFAFGDKGFTRLVAQVQAEFDQAVIFLHLPENDMVPSDMEAILDTLRQVITKPGIDVRINRRFFTKAELLQFLATKSMNIFLYDEHKKAGISSVVEKAIAVQRPVAVSRSGMFRHVHGASPSITLGDRSLREILAEGIAPLVPFLNDWSEGAFLQGFERALDRVLELPSATAEAAAPDLPTRVAYYETASGNYFLPTDAPGDIVIQAMKRGEVFEPEIVESARHFIRPGSVVLDLGANFGQMSVLFSKLAGDTGKVYAFEASAFVHELLERNLKANGCRNVIPVFRAVYDRDGIELVFPEPDFNRFASYGSFGLAPKVKNGPKVQTLTIDSLDIREPISFMKVDIQGSDLFALRGAVKTIERHQMPILFEFEESLQEDFGTCLQDYLDFIEQIHYRVHQVLEVSGSRNYLIVPKDMKVPVGDESPAPGGVQPPRILWVRGRDEAGDVLALATLPALARAYPGAELTVVAPQATLDLYLPCPHLAGVIGFDPVRAERDPDYLRALAARLATLQPLLALSTGSGDDPVASALLEGSGARLKAGYDGEATRGVCQVLVTPEGPLELEQDRHRRLLTAIKVPCPESLDPSLWFGPTQHAEAEALFQDLRVDPSRAILFFPGGGQPIQRAPGFTEALSTFAREQGLAVIGLGTPAEYALVEAALQGIEGPTYNLCGALSLGQTAALLRRCRLAAGPEGRWVHLACALGIPHVVALGGGEFGRFAPYSRWTTAVALPLACYACGWQCPHARVHCLSDLQASTLLAGLRTAWARDSALPRMVLQAGQPEDAPPPLDLAPSLDPARVQCLRFDTGTGTLEPPQDMTPPAHTIAIMLPSRGRMAALRATLEAVPTARNMKFIVIANYEDPELEALKTDFSHKIHVIDERRYGEGGIIKTVNIAYYLARELGFDYAMGFADDMMPQSPTWHDELNDIITATELDFGIFSTDECHKGVFGWNFFANHPCAHVCIGRIAAVGDHFLNPAFFSYVADAEIAIRMWRKEARIRLMPIRIHHNHNVDETRNRNAKFYQIDVNIFNALYPDLRGQLDDVVLKGTYQEDGTFVLDLDELLDARDFRQCSISHRELLASRALQERRLAAASASRQAP